MSATFNSRRKARVVGQDGDRDTSEEIAISEPATKRAARPKHRSRVSLGLGGTSMTGEDNGDDSVITPKRGLARRAFEKSTPLNSSRLGTSSNAKETVAQENNQSQPSYSKEYLSELKNAQQIKSDNANESHDPTISHDAQVATRFGTEVSTFISDKRNTLIPTDLEVQALKAKRARLAKLEKYNIDPEASEDDDPRDDRPGSDEDEFLTHRDKILLRDERAINKKEVDTRLLRDDEDLLEGFGDLTGENTRVPLGATAQSEAKMRQRAELRDLIEEAQKEDTDDDSVSEAEQKQNYEASQTRRGTENLRNNGARETRSTEGAQTPRKITPIPELEECIQRLRGRLLDMEENRKVKLSRLQDLQTEKKEVIEREAEIQRLLSEKAMEYEKMSAEVGSGQRLLEMNHPSVLLSERVLDEPGPPKNESIGALS